MLSFATTKGTMADVVDVDNIYPLAILWDDQGMGRANQALKQVLETYGISQNKLAVALGIDRSAVFKWVHDQREPSSETIVEITQVLKTLNPLAAKEFVKLYLGTIVED
ncbi:helix-turn-helix domain-containing protein [Nodosilinea sp. AN01ver1]|uniref:helix-turn-helix domain-containing protein n=1 Tax=Nodosilinea sp. AN01ver1 TaxID=3423362 RepID=UPI003D3138E2